MNTAEPLLPRQNLTDGYTIPRIINGTWQLSAGHSQSHFEDSLSLLRQLADAGLVAFDCADIYTGVEELLGRFLDSYQDRTGHEGAVIQIHTKCVPDLESLPSLTAGDITAIVDRSLRRLGVERLDLVQLHWWDFNIPGVVEASLALDRMRRQGKLRAVGVTNFDVLHLEDLLDAGVCVVSNQVQFSLLDHRPERGMLALCQRHGISLFCYGTIAGGFLSDRYLDQPDPLIPLENRSLVKYRLIIEEFGGWKQFQLLLRTLRRIADKHGVSIAAVATRYVLQKPHVAAAIIGVRRADHVADTLRLFSFALDSEDLACIASVCGADGPGPQGSVYALERMSGGSHASIMHTNLCRGQDTKQ
ncbi:aldo/keto reductase [Candidatus Bipolaricaulota bacterium]|nr:aldo/keto reductase [Candidatus Bipolaricaulota bacterium]